MGFCLFFNFWGLDFAHLCLRIRPCSFFCLHGFQGTLGCALQEGIHTEHHFVLLNRQTL